MQKRVVIALFCTVFSSQVCYTGPFDYLPSGSSFVNPGLLLAKNAITNNFHTVQKHNLYRSAQPSPKQLRKIVKYYGIKTVINLRGEHQQEHWWQEERDICKVHKLAFFNIPMSAQTLPSRENLVILLNAYDTAPRPILVHCLHGCDRTGEAAALWCLEQQGLSKNKALEQLTPYYGHYTALYPAKQLLIKLWQGRDWMEQRYSPEQYAYLL